MSAHSTANDLDGLTGGILLALMIAGERGADRARQREAQRQDILQHNARVARARAARRRQDAAMAEQVRVGQARMARWLDIVH